VVALEEVMRRLDLDESKALCTLEKVLRLAENFSEKIASFENDERKLEGALDLVEALKSCLAKYMPYLNEQQKEKVCF
jgi:hypothetical protein